MSRYSEELNQKGFAIAENIYSDAEVKLITDHIQRIHGTTTSPGIRRFLQITPGLQDLLFNSSLKTLLTEIAPKHFVVNSIYFDKPPGSNWFVSFHRDQTIYVKQKTDAFGFKNWTQKDGGFGVQPPAEYLGDMVTIRIHLDEADETNGALKVIPHTHSEASVRPIVASSFSESDSVLCPVKAGGVMLMKPLLFHASSKSTSDKPRRVIHLELCSLELPEGMEWAEKS